MKMSQISTELQSRLPRYKLKERLGAGGMATVYRAEDTNLGRDVAIKVLHEHLLQEESFKDRFQQEARFIANFKHPNIVQIYDFNVIETNTSKFYYMVMPFLSGKTLVDVLADCRENNETLPHDRTLQIVQDIASALDYAHERGMVHRDVKPANILFDENKRAILTDFGIARLAERSQFTVEGTIVGTPAYMSPEQALGATIDHRSDIYALGIILFELLTGQTPFEDDGTISVLLKHAQDEPPSISDFTMRDNIALDLVAHNALAKKPEDRYQSAGALVNDLKAAIETESTQDKIQPIVISKKQNTVATSSATRVLEGGSEKPKRQITDSFTRTLHTLVVRPAKQNPMGFAALAISIVVLLLVARLVVQNPFAAEATPQPTMDSVDSMTSETFYFESDFSHDDTTLALWQQDNSGSPERRYVDDGNYIITNNNIRVAMTALFDESYHYEDVTITLDGTLQSSTDDPNGAYGIVFRYQDAQNYNVFAVDGMGRFSIWVRESGSWRELRGTDENWLANDSIHTMGESNTLMITIYHNHIIGYVNGMEVISLDEDTFDSGSVGIYMATANSPATVAIDRYTVAPADISVESMTGDDHVESMTGEEKTDSMTGNSEPTATAQQ